MLSKGNEVKCYTMGLETMSSKTQGWDSIFFFLRLNRYPYSIPLKGIIHGEPTSVGVGSLWLLDTSHPLPPKKVSQARKPLNGDAKKLSSIIYGTPFLMSSKPGDSNMGV
jgi:hypothetical protein